MRKSVAKAMDPRIEDLWEYFGLGDKGVSHFERRRPFCPGKGPLSISAPRQLHYTARHDGCYIQVDGLGCPDLKREVVDMLDGFDWKVMVEATDYLFHVKQEFHETLMAVTRRSSFSSKAEVARAFGMTPEGQEYRLHKACEIMLEHLDLWLERDVNKQTATK